MNDDSYRKNFLTTKKTRPTQASDENSILENSKQDDQSANFKITERNITKGQRTDKYGNPITKKGKQKISFLDKVSPSALTIIINIESFKDFNKMEEITTTGNSINSCCSLF